MCGIVGVVNIYGNPLTESSVIQQMASKIVHRGPDEERIFLDGPVGFGFRRLSIIDLDTGSQPIANETEKIWVMFNGEIYNFVEMRRDLKARGHIFKTRSDTEVIVHAYEEYGLSFIRYLRGMFAIALWDSLQQRLLLVRDRLGKKPLFYSLANGQLAFSSEIKGLVPWSGFRRTLNEESIHDYLTLLYVPTPRTIFSNIQKLPPAHWLCLDCRTGSTEIDQYWTLPVQPEPERSITEYQDALRAKIMEAVRIRLRSDVPVGTFLSGGIDSTIVTGIVSREAPSVTAYSIGFEDERFNEAPIAALSARSFNLKHVSETILANQFSPDDFMSVASYLDEPFADSSFVPTYWVAKSASKHVKVALTGDGGDELFAGYTRYPRLVSLQKLGHIPGWITTPLQFLLNLAWLPVSKANSDWGERVRQLSKALGISGKSLPVQMTALHTYYDEKNKSNLYTKEWREQLNGYETTYLARAIPAGTTGDLDVMGQFMAADILNGLLDDALVKTDRASMACSLELRSPFLDHEVVELAMKIPVRYKYQRGVSKWILKQAFRDMLPEDVLYRKKQGFEIPFAYWFQQSNWRTFLVDMLSESRLKMQGIFDAQEVIRLRDLILDDPEARAIPMSAYQLRHRIWILLMFQVWSYHYMGTS